MLTWNVLVLFMIMLWHGNTFRITDPLYEGSIGQHCPPPSQKDNNAELWPFLCRPEKMMLGWTNSRVGGVRVTSLRCFEYFNPLYTWQTTCLYTLVKNDGMFSQSSKGEIEIPFRDINVKFCWLNVDVFRLGGVQYFVFQYFVVTFGKCDCLKVSNIEEQDCPKANEATMTNIVHDQTSTVMTYCDHSKKHNKADSVHYVWNRMYLYIMEETVKICVGCVCGCFNTLRPRQDGRSFADDDLKCIFLNENVWIPIKISLKFVPKDPVNNIPALVQIMAWRRPGDKPLSEPMMVNLLTHICVTRPQWVKNSASIKRVIVYVLDQSHKSPKAPVPYPTTHIENYGGVEGPPHIFFRHHAISYGWHNNSSVGDSNYCYVIRRTN